MAKYMIFNADQLRAALITEQQAESRKEAIEAMQQSLLPVNGVYVLKRSDIDTRYLAPPPLAREEKLVFVGLLFDEDAGEVITEQPEGAPVEPMSDPK